MCGLYDGIFAVPPYIPYEELSELDPEMIEYEPHLAFLAHEDGLEYVRLLIEKGRDYLVDGGMLCIEADIDDNERVREMVKNTGWSKLEFWPDPYGATPNIILTK
jgi:release factor glutamine methyltransferase